MTWIFVMPPPHQSYTALKTQFSILRKRETEERVREVINRFCNWVRLWFGSKNYLAETGCNQHSLNKKGLFLVWYNVWEEKRERILKSSTREYHILAQEWNLIST